MSWISVKDKLPQKNETVLLWGIREHQHSFDVVKGYFCDAIYIDGIKEEYWESEYAYDVTNVTHWMPIPAPPTN